MVFLELVEAFGAHQLFEITGKCRSVVVGGVGLRPVLRSAVRHVEKVNLGGRLVERTPD
jgi:hypothetical protein